MKPLRLYQIPFSHFCDKVRWALDFYSIPFESINYIGPQTPGLKRAPRTLQRLTPIIEDPNNEDLFISDSTPMLIYLDEHYGKDKTLFPVSSTTDKDKIVQYCLKLDSQLGLYARRLAYLHVISEKPAILSVFFDQNFTKTSCDDWKSYFNGLLGSAVIISRFGLHRVREENAFEKTISVLEEIQEDIRGKDYLFNNQFTAADLTLSALIRPLKTVNSFSIKYKPLFDYADRIRERHDPKQYEETYAERLLYESRRRTRSSSSSFISVFISKIFFILTYPLKLLIDYNEPNKPLFQYPSANLEQKANNDNRVIRLNSLFNSSWFFLKNIYHFYFTLPKQMNYVNNEGKKLLQMQSHL